MVGGAALGVVEGTAVSVGPVVGAAVAVEVCGGVPEMVGSGVLVAGGVPVIVGVLVGTAVPADGVEVAVGAIVPSVVADGIGDGSPVGVMVGVAIGVIVGGMSVGGGGTVAGSGGRKRLRPAKILVSDRQLACMMAKTVVPCRRARLPKVSPGRTIYVTHHCGGPQGVRAGGVGGK